MHLSTKYFGTGPSYFSCLVKVVVTTLVIGEKQLYSNTSQKVLEAMGLGV